MAYQPIENYGIIGDLHSVALVGLDGSIDWLCLPHFDSPSVFAAILDDEKGGRFKIAPTSDGVTRKQLYWPDGVAEITDYMPIDASANGRGHHQLIRRVEVVRGEINFQLECSPAFNFARDGHETEISAEGASFHSPQLSLGLAASVPLKRRSDGVVAEFTLREELMAVFVLRQIEPG